MSITYRTSTFGGATSGSSNRSAGPMTPVVGDLWVVFAAVTGCTNDTPTCTDDNGGTYDLIRSVALNSSADRLYCFVRTALMPNTTNTSVTVGSGSNTSGEVVIVACSGSGRVGSATVRQSAVQANQAAGTAAPTFAAACLTGNMTLGAVGCGTNPPGIAAPTGWTERHDVGQNTPPVGVEVATRNSGFTGTTVTWGTATASAFASVVIELNGDVQPIAAATGSLTLTGTAVRIAHQYKAAAATGSLSLTGTAVGTKHGYKVAAAIGSYTITGTAVRTVKNSRTAAATGSLVLSGQSVALRTAHPLATTAGSYALTGTAVDLSYTAATVTIAPGQPAYYLPWFLVPEEFVEAPVTSPPALSIQGDTYALTGTAVTLARSLKFAAASGSYAITGTDIGATYTPVPAGVNPGIPAYYWLRGLTPEDVAPVMAQAYTVPTDSGSYGITGQAVGLKIGYKEAVDTGSYVQTGQPVGLRTGPIGVISSGSYALTGTAVSLVRGAATLAAAAGSYAVTGTAVRLAIGFRTATTTGAYLLAGTAVRLARGLRVAAVTGVYVLTGTAVSLVRGRPIVVGSGAYTQTGQSVALRATHRIATATGSLTLTGQTVSLQYSGSGAKLIDVNPGAYSVAGQSIVLRRTTKFPATAGSLSLTGSPVALSRQLRTAANPGSYLLGGQSAGLYWRPFVAVGVGAYAFSGQAVAVRHGYPFTAGQGVYVVGGEDVELVPTKAVGVGGGTYAFTGSAIGLEWSGLVPDPGDAGFVVRPPAGTATRIFHPPSGTAGRIWRFDYGGLV